ncbi:MAG: hypothetical protein M3362_25940, partial [Acidobacteriota bacterium]|nr:hypothetical protein [Acidobacteriota bacterium]
MKKQDQKTRRRSENTDPPHWLTAALRLAGDAAAFENPPAGIVSTSAAFCLRCRQAARMALGILKLRQERQRIGFVPVPLTDYIQGLMKVADVPTPQVLAAVSPGNLALQTPEWAAGLGRFTKAIGLSLRETLVHLRIGFAAQHQS